MKQKDDATLSLFGDELPASDLHYADASRKKIPGIQTEGVIPVDPPFDIRRWYDGDNFLSLNIW